VRQSVEWRIIRPHCRQIGRASTKVKTDQLEFQLDARQSIISLSVPSGIYCTHSRLSTSLRIHKALHQTVFFGEREIQWRICNIDICGNLEN